jgi:hypothetical protein
MEIISVPVIVTAVYWIMNTYKVITKEQEKYMRWIPVLALATGIIMGVLCFYASPDLMPTDNVAMAIMIGGSSGLAATGTNQVFKQLSKEPEKPDKTDW